MSAVQAVLSPQQSMAAGPSQSRPPVVGPLIQDPPSRAGIVDGDWEVDEDGLSEVSDDIDFEGWEEADQAALPDVAPGPSNASGSSRAQPAAAAPQLDGDVS